MILGGDENMKRKNKKLTRLILAALMSAGGAALFAARCGYGGGYNC